MTRDKAVGAASDDLREDTRFSPGDTNCEEDGGVGGGMDDTGGASRRPIKTCE